MSVILDQMNSAGHGFVEFAVPMLVQSSLLIVILLLVDVLLRKRARAVFRYWIWMLVLLKFVLPTSLSTPVSLGHWLGEGFALMDTGPMIAAHNTAGINPDKHALLAIPVTPGAESSRPISEAVGSPGVPVAQITWQGIVFLVWLVVVIVMALLLLQRSLFVRGLVARARKADGSMNDTLAHCCHSMGVRRKVGLRISTHTTSPAVCRLFRPVILLPQNLMPSLEASQLPAVLMHELAHLKRFDLWVNFGQTLLQILYFYNPLLWLANTTIRRVREQAVDEAVLVAMGEKAQLYPQTLVNVAKLAFRGPTLSLRLIGVVESKNLFEWRIKTMLNRPIPKSSKLGVVGTIVIFTVAAVLLPMARAQKVDVGSKPVATENEGKPTKSLHQAAADGDIEQVKKLIAQGADVNEKRGLGTPLHYASEKGHTEVAKLLISRGAHVNAMDRNLAKPLHYAAKQGNKQTVELLLSKGADINAKNRDGRTPLFEAMKSSAAGRKEVVELLASKGAKVPAFHLAVYMADMEKLIKCLEEGINVNTPSDCNITALHAAANSGKKEIVEFLISKGADVDAEDALGVTPLYYAAMHKYQDIADLLLAKGADVNAKDKDRGGFTLLYHAIWDSNKDAISTTTLQKLK